MTILGILGAWLLAYWLDVVVVVVFALLMVWFIRRGNQGAVKRIILYLVVQAEKELGSGTGPLKYATVTTLVYNYLPLILRLVFSKADLDIFIEEAVRTLKATLKDPQTNLLPYDQEALACTEPVPRSQE